MRLQSSTLFFAVFFVVLGVLAVIATHELFTIRYAAQNDFLPRWEGARGFWQEGISPYSETATRNIQQMIFGRAARSGEDLSLFVYPFYTVFVVAPFTVLSYSWAAAAIIVALVACLLAGLFLILDVLRWRVSPLMLGVLVLFTITNYYAVRGVNLGQLGHVVYALQMGTLWALFRRYDRVAGVALAIATIKPQMGIFIVPFLLLWGVRVQRWQFVGVFVLAFGALMGVSFVLLPSWLGDWLAQVSLYPSYTRDGSPVHILMQMVLGAGDVGEGVVNAVLGAWMLWLWWAVLGRGEHARMLWTVAMTLIITHLIALKTATPHFVVFSLPFLFALQSLAKQKMGVWAVAGVLLGVGVGVWWHFLVTIDGNLEHLSLFLPAPFIMLGVTWAMRRTWWARKAQGLGADDASA